MPVQVREPSSENGNDNGAAVKRVRKTATGTSLLARSRNITSYHQNLPSHPLGVKPSTNIIMAADEDLAKIKHSAGSFFNRASDDLILSIFGMLDKQDLITCSKVSKFWYAFATFDELWRNMYTSIETDIERERAGVAFNKWNGSWRNSILGVPSLQSTRQGAVDCSKLVYSDALFTPYVNSCVDYDALFDQIIEEQKNLKLHEGYMNATELSDPSKYPHRGRIPRIEEDTFTYEMFEQNHWNSHPFILGSAKYDLPENTRWLEWTVKYLLERFPDVKFRQESVLWELQRYEDYAKDNFDENPLYLFDCRSKAMKDLLPTGYYANPPVFAREDLFKTFGGCRPDHSWLITGPKRSGSTFHKDPNSTDAWNVVLEGSKLWIMLPPGMKPPGVFVSDDESEVMSPNGLAEWVKSGYWNDSIQLSDEATLDTKDNSFGSGGFRTCVVGITFSNECMYVPSGWWHMVINLEDSVAFTANFVPPCKMGQVLKFMKHKPDQVSGFRHDLLQKEVAEFFKTNNVQDDKNIEKIKQYMAREDLRNNDEDVGELKGTGCMPIYEAFIEFLKARGHADLLQNALREAEMSEVKQVKSKVWENLTKSEESSSGGFSFGFGFDEE